MVELSKGEIEWLIEQFNTIEIMAAEFAKAVATKKVDFDEYDYKYLVDEYSAAKKSFESLKDNTPFCLKEISYIPERKDINGLRRNLYTMALESRKAKAYLREIKSPLISNESKSELKSLREEIEKISSKLEPYIKQNYILAIDSFEDEHILGAALIASRIIDYYLAQLEGKDIDAKIVSIRSKIKSRKKREDIRDFEQNLIKSSKFARNLLSHNISAIPESDESLSLLSNCVGLMKIMIN